MTEHTGDMTTKMSTIHITRPASAILSEMDSDTTICGRPTEAGSANAIRLSDAKAQGHIVTCRKCRRYL